MDSQRNMREISRQLNLDMGSTSSTSFVPKTISDILTELSLIHDFSLKSSKLNFHVHLLGEELRKIEAFKRELPYCMQILQDAIELLKKEHFRLRKIEEASMSVTEDMLPPLQSDEHVPEKNDGGVQSSNDVINDMKNWMSRVRLWNAPVQFCSDTSEAFPFKSPSRGGGVAALKRSSGAMKAARAAKRNTPIEEISLSVHVEPLNCGKRYKHHKKQRRCWSNELHMQFVGALMDLGGTYKATPKQIREWMKIEGLTNDEVKSHLQKYRLHMQKKLALQKLSQAGHFTGECSTSRGGGGVDENKGKAVVHD